MNNVAEDFFSDTALIGIGSAQPAHRFCWAVNKAFDFNFVREPESDIVYNPTKEEKHFFSLYEYSIPFSSCRHLLYKLRSDKKVLLPEIKQLDYLWLISSPTAEEEASIIINYLRNLPDVQLAQFLDHNRLTNINLLLL